MRSPYIVGRWVRGEHHYGRQRIIDYLLTVPDAAVWLVGTRRMGKTSILRQLEQLTDRPDCELEPLFWDMQGCETPQDFFDELQYALDDALARFEAYGLTREDLEARDAVGLLRKVMQRLDRHDRKLFLLIDEAEALLSVGASEPGWLARLRKIFQDTRQRTVMTSTKRLAQLNDLTADWLTSPFLFGFNLANLWSLDPDSAAALVRQSQAETPVLVDDEVLREVLHATNRHPYLIQYLCQRIFVATDDGHGRLRSVEPQDLLPDHLLAGFFQVDFQHLSPIERRILLTTAQRSMVDENEILGALYDLAPARLRTFLYGLNKLGYVRQIDDQWTVGNEFLRHWIHENMESLDEQRESAIHDASVEEILTRGVVQEATFLREQIALQQEQLKGLERRARAAGPQTPATLVQQIDAVRQSLSILRQDMARLQPVESSRNVYAL